MEKKEKIKNWLITIFLIAFFVLIFGTEIFAGLFPDAIPSGGFLTALIADLQGLNHYDVCVNWIGPENGGECMSWKSDQRLENCPKIVIDKFEKEFCILE